MIWLLLVALASYPNQPDIVATDGDLRVCVASCLHVGQDAVLGDRDSMTIALDGFVAAGCDVGVFIGDALGSRDFAGRDANGDPISSPIPDYGPAGLMPRDEELTELVNQLSAHPTWSGPTFIVAGNHDGSPGRIATVWDNLSQPGVKGIAPGTSLEAFVVRTEVECAGDNQRVDWLLLGDTNRTQDIGVCGQLDTVSGQELTKSGAPATHYTAGQLDFLRSRLQRTAEIGRDLAVLAHVPPPETTFGTWQGEGSAPLTGWSSGSLHGPTWTQFWTDLERPSYHWPSAATGLTQPETCDRWNGTNAIQADGTADPGWLRRMLGEMEAHTGNPHPLALWVGGHSHMPSPIWVQNGHAMWALLQPDGGGDPVPVIQTGGMTRHHGAWGTAQFVVAEMRCDGRHVERWVSEVWCSAAQCDTWWRPTSYPAEALVPREAW